MGDLGNIFSVLGFSIFGLVLVVSMGISVLPFAYVILRWREGGQGEPGHGTRAAVLFLRSLALLIALLGASLMVYRSIKEPGTDSSDRELLRTAIALLCAGSAVLFLQELLFAALREPLTSAQTARRIFAGFVATVCGLVFLVFFVSLLVMLFAREGDEHRDGIRLCIAFVFVWGPAYLVQTICLLLGARRQVLVQSS